MRTRLRRLTLVAFAALVTAIPLTISSQSAGVVAVECANGHNWDNIRQTCV
jgi:hypothetical protein